MKQKKITKNMLKNYYGPKDIKDFLSFSNVQALNWLEEANAFFYKTGLKNWKKDQEMMKKIGW